MRHLYTIKDWTGKGDGAPLNLDDDGRYWIEGEFFFLVVDTSKVKGYIIPALHGLANIVINFEKN